MPTSRAPLALIASFLAALVLTAPPATAHPLPAQDVKFIDDTVAAQMAASGTPGVTVSVLAPGKGRLLRSYGQADTSTGRALDPADHYRIASVTKTFVATAVLALAEKGRIHLDDPLERYIRGVPNGDRITIAQLLGMRAGVFDYVYDEQFVNAYNADPLLPSWRPRDILGVLARNASQAKPPGELTVYSNSNYVLLGLLLERVARKPLHKVITRKVIRPLGLRETTYPTSTTLPAPFSRGYDDTLGTVRDVTVQSVRVPAGAGAMISTVPDMTRYAKALATGALLSHHTQRERTAFQPMDTGSPFFVGYGLGMLRIGDWLGHDGSIFGYSNFVMHLPEERATIVVMVNKGGTNDVAATDTWFEIARHLYPDSFPPL